MVSLHLKILWFCYFLTGSHGAGHQSETLTPLVAWGAGVRGPVINNSSNKYRDNFSQGIKYCETCASDRPVIIVLFNKILGNTCYSCKVLYNSQVSSNQTARDSCLKTVGSVH